MSDVIAPEVRELAAKTAAEIRRRGWGQGTMADDDAWYEALGDDIYEDEDNEIFRRPPEEWFNDCKVCLIGGVAAAAVGDPRKGWELVDRFGPAPIPPAADALINLLARRTGTHSAPGVYHWNDADDRTEDEVLHLLDSIATGTTETEGAA